MKMLSPECIWLRRPVCERRSSYMGFVVDKVQLVQVFSEYFNFPSQFSFHRLLHIRHLSSGAGIIGQLVADVPSGLSLKSPKETKKRTSPDGLPRGMKPYPSPSNTKV
jgi:hypothetical protein